MVEPHAQVLTSPTRAVPKISPPDRSEPSVKELPSVPAPAVGQRRRSTVRRQAVLDALRTSDNFRSARQLYVEMCQQQDAIRVALTTIYRILHALADERIAEAQRAEDGEILYRLRVGTEHQHYLLCRRCGRAVAFTPTELEERTSELTARYHYADVAHHIDIYGTCPRCLSD
ncbi:Fur family transcriptional regulator [Mycobacterium simulans]|uniref:Fur family transcriptional regulator n=1 Tax=Mycobacterium simulans TaxID=627089 RepID=UPI0016408435|nr:transcriptional repressor [Mycobacterium simulans]